MRRQAAKLDNPMDIPITPGKKIRFAIFYKVFGLKGFKLFLQNRPILRIIDQKHRHMKNTCLHQCQKRSFLQMEDLDKKRQRSVKPQSRNWG